MQSLSLSIWVIVVLAANLQIVLCFGTGVRNILTNGAKGIKTNYNKLNGEVEQLFEIPILKKKFTEENYQLYYDAKLCLLSIISGVTTSYIVTESRRAISALDNICGNRNKIAPLIGSILVTLLYLLDNRVSLSPFAVAERAVINNKKEINICFKRQILRLITVITVVGSGCSLGFTAPAAEIGMSISLMLAQFLPTQSSDNNDYSKSVRGHNYNKNRQYYLVLAGAGAGVAANLNAPLTGALYSMEISKFLLGDHTSFSDTKTNIGVMGDGSSKPDTKWNNRGMSSAYFFNDNDYRVFNINRGKSAALFLACAAACLAVRGGKFVGAEPILKSFIPDDHIPDVLEIPLFMILGILSGFLAHSFACLKGKLFQIFKTVSPRQSYRPIIAGVLCSIAACIGSPQSLAVGYKTLDRVISGALYSNVPTQEILHLSRFTFEKLLMVAASAASGLIGGQFSPLLFAGAGLGGLFFHTTRLLLPAIKMHSCSVYALAGAASLLAGNFRAPLTAIVLMLELTKQLDLTLPLFVSVGLSTLVAKILLGRTAAPVKEGKGEKQAVQFVPLLRP